ncbi:ABC transporter substrate-binding protein [Paenibacillus eucommiae]|uniref:Iron complex transport system substrate-binding protein n=1 Tax=Paenibacillus eucommiae TaxID=1355755 RepID=A0ABS4IXC1_9BACL|nr:ABC transporter substrate-binding protein [Paenibacillus eucommiae]MBP1992229.1 iron complex transport system substrate-binding protein [Paenibacillus eucommiae]
MNGKRMTWIMLLLAALLVMSACGKTVEKTADNSSSPGSSMNASSSPAADGSTGSTESQLKPEAKEFEPITVSDATGAKLEFTKKVEKVACVVSLCVDILAELGLEPVAIGESGVRTIATQQEFYGSKGEAFASIGGSFFEPSLEDIVSVKPDLVIGLKSAHDGLRDGLKGAAPIYLANPKSYTESVEVLETIGKLTGRSAEAEAAKHKFLDKLAQAKEKSPKDKKALIMFGSDVNFAIVADTGLGGTLLKEVTLYPWKVTDPSTDPYGDGGIQYSLEKVLEENPDVLFVESYSYSPGTKPLSEQLAASPLWSKLKAVQNKQVYEVRSPIWGDGRGTRSLGVMLDESMKLTYPDKF